MWFCCHFLPKFANVIYLTIWEERCASIISHCCSSWFGYPHRIGSSQMVIFVFWSLSSWHHIPSHLCAHSAPPISCPEHELTLPSHASTLSGKISQWPFYNKCIFLVFCSTWALSFQLSNVIAIESSKVWVELDFFDHPLLRWHMDFNCGLIGNLRHVQGRSLTSCETYGEPLTLLSLSFLIYKMGKWYLNCPPQRIIVSSIWDQICHNNLKFVNLYKLLLKILFKGLTLLESILNMMTT